MKLKDTISRIIGWGINAYILFCVVVLVVPQWLFYDPTHQASDLSKAQADGFAAERIDYQAADGTSLYAWYVKPQGERPVIVFLHGNSYNIEAFYHKLKPLAAAGYGILLPEYRGFGEVKGKITQKGLEQDAVAAIRQLYDRGFGNADIYLYGMSLGSYTATYSAHLLGQEVPFAGLILEVPFDSLYEDVKDIVRFPLPFAMLVSDKYDNMPLIKDLRLPLLVMGGQKDTLVPVRHAQLLFAAANEPKKMIVYPEGKHANLFEFANYRDILTWLSEHEKNRF